MDVMITHAGNPLESSRLQFHAFTFSGNLEVAGMGLVLISLELHVTVKIYVRRKDFAAN
jgi:hypothetical protein